LRLRPGNRDPEHAFAVVAGAFSCRLGKDTQPMPQFDATIKHLKEGVKGFTISAAVKNIEGWEATLEKLEVSGKQTVIKDLESLKKQLQSDEINTSSVKKLVAKLAKETITMSGKAEGKNAEKVKQLGEALNAAVEHAE